ncbi:hypothetical protein CY35_10G016300 [Sphagnum magellanicum]|nr:hypothetical protein CY35_10G016300 [Sphagnum magellanicum]
MSPVWVMTAADDTTPQDFVLHLTCLPPDSSSLTSLLLNNSSSSHIGDKERTMYIVLLVLVHLSLVLLLVVVVAVLPLQQHKLLWFFLHSAPKTDKKSLERWLLQNGNK